MTNTNRPAVQTTTRTVAGYTLTLASGVRYRASRPFATRGRTTFPVTITPIDGTETPGARIGDLSYDQANRLLKAFNDGAMSFDGRMWA